MAPQERPFTRNRASGGIQNAHTVGQDIENAENASESNANLSELDNIPMSSKKLVSPSNDDQAISSSAIPQGTLLPFVNKEWSGKIVKIVVGGENVVPPNDPSSNNDFISEPIGEAKNSHVKGPNDDNPTSPSNDIMTNVHEMDPKVASDGSPGEDSAVPAINAESLDDPNNAPSPDLPLPLCDKEIITRNGSKAAISTGEGFDANGTTTITTRDDVATPSTGNGETEKAGVAGVIEEKYQTDASMTGAGDNAPHRESNSALTPLLFNKDDVNAIQHEPGCPVEGAVTPDDADEDLGDCAPVESPDASLPFHGQTKDKTIASEKEPACQTEHDGMSQQELETSGDKPTSSTSLLCKDDSPTSKDLPDKDVSMGIDVSLPANEAIDSNAENHNASAEHRSSKGGDADESHSSTGDHSSTLTTLNQDASAPDLSGNGDTIEALFSSYGNLDGTNTSGKRDSTIEQYTSTPRPSNHENAESNPSKSVQDSPMLNPPADDSPGEETMASNETETPTEGALLPRVKVTPQNGDTHSSTRSLASSIATSTDKRNGKDHTTNRYKVNGIIRRPCVCANSDECREMMAFWCEAVDDDLTCRDPCRAGYIRLPVYQPNAKTPIQLYKNSLRLSYLGHLRPPGSKPSARWLATTRRKGKNTAEFIALHHFPREFLKKTGNGLKIEYLDEDMARNYKLSKNDKINVEGHPWTNNYFAPPCYKWADLVSEYEKATAVVGAVTNKQISSPAAAREVTRDARPKILCLGMSKACVESQMDVEGYYWDILDDEDATVQQVVELVCRGILTEMDGRDLARVRAMEKLYKVDAYTVSQESGSEYDSNFHLHANFNRANFCDALAKTFNKPKFRQVALDYYWIPSGTWSIQHWGKSFFRVTLPNLVKKELLEYPPESQYGAKPSTQKLAYGVVYLPFCLHCITQLIGAIGEIKQYYKITFLYKNELEEHALWSGTSTICAKIMQGRFGKNIAQEEIYCTFAPRDVFEAMEDEHITKEDVVEVLRGIEDFAEVRMIRLTPLAKHNPRFKRIKRYEDEVGGFVSLLDPSEVQRGFDSLLPTSRMMGSSSSEEEKEESSSEEEVEVAPPPPIQKKAPVGRKRQTNQVLLPSVATTQPKRPKKRMFEVLPDLETYCSLGLEGNEDVADYYALPERKRRRKRCDIATYHFGPEPKTDEEPLPEIVPRPSLLSKLTLSFASGYDVDTFRRRRDGQEAMADSTLYDARLPPTAQDKPVDDTGGSLMMLACANEARTQESGDQTSDDDAISPGYLMMLAYTSELPGIQLLENERRAAVESYTSILASVANESVPVEEARTTLSEAEQDISSDM